MVIGSFIDPYKKVILQKKSDGNLYYRNQTNAHLYKNYDGIYDFVLQGSELWKEREHYDREYSVGRSCNWTEDSIRDAWYIDIYPWRKTLLDSLGEIRDKKILLVGNGESYDEFHFLTLGAKIVLTDLSIEAVKQMRKEFAASNLYETYCDKIEFHAVDASNLPFQDGEFDIIYGGAFAHHLEHLDPFISEVCRCLKRGGICRFIDEADSPLWRSLKGTILYPLKVYSYKRVLRSPADLRGGGFTFEEIASLKDKYGFRDSIFIREWFLLRIVSRHYGMFVNYNPKAMRWAQLLFLAMKWLDKKLAHTKWMQRNQLMLVWGFNK